MIPAVSEVIQNELDIFQDHFKKSMQSRIALLDRIAYYIIRTKGKQIRPVFVLLTAKLCGQVTESSYTAAALIELVHTASLVHDDVVDDARTRRGFFSINALWKHKAAVLVGDYLLSKGLLIALDNKEYEVLHRFSRAVKQISEGELLQMEKSRNLNLSEDIYYDIIRQKTASLIASACACGALSAGASPKMVEQAELLGELIGMAFQMKDDLFDYEDQSIGKPTGIDIKEKKLTLPLIYALNRSEPAERRTIINLIKNESHKKEKRQEVIQFVQRLGGLEYGRNKMVNYHDHAVDILRSNFSAGKERDAFEKLIGFVIAREK